MTPRKRWPTAADDARLEAIGAAMTIVDLGTEAKEAAQAGRRDLTLAKISDMQLAAKDIELALRLARVGEEG